MRLEGGLQLLRTQRVEVEPAGDAAVGVPGEGQEPLLGRVRFGPVLVQAFEHPVDQPDEVLVRPVGGEAGQHLATPATVPPCASTSAAYFGAADLGDHIDLVGGQLPGGVLLLDRGQLFQRAAGADHLRCGRLGHPAVPAQPRRRRGLPVGGEGPLAVGDRTVRASSAAEAVPVRHQVAGALEQLGAAERVEFVVRTHVRRISEVRPRRVLNPQVRSLSTDLVETFA